MVANSIAPARVRPEALKVLALQRPTYRRMTVAEAGTAISTEVSEYCSSIRSFLPRGGAGKLRFLDIGCGLGFGLLAYKTLYGAEHEFVGYDRSVVDKDVFYGFEKVASAYNDLTFTRDFLVDNGVAATNIKMVNVDADPFPDGPFDFISSHIAWGFHFPVDVYLDKVKSVSKKGSHIMIDLRNGTDGVVKMASNFQLLAAFPFSKSVRTVWRVE